MERRAVPADLGNSIDFSQRSQKNVTSETLEGAKVGVMQAGGSL